MKHTDVSRQAAATLTTINEALRRAEDLTWHDPGFLEWEREQVGELAIDKVSLRGTGLALRQWAFPGPGHDRHGGHQGGFGVHSAPMMRLAEDHAPYCGECNEGMPLDVTRAAMSTRAADYPSPAETTYGPLLLGPEPPIAGERVGLVISDETLALYAGDVEAIAAVAGEEGPTDE